MQKILITGGAGFIGSNAANMLSQSGYEVVAMDNLFLGWEANLEPQVKFVNGDVKNPVDLEAIGPVDFVIHLAASSSAPMFVEDLAGSFHNNVVGHVNVLEYARKFDVKKVLFASTSSIYGNNPIPLTEDQEVVPPNFYSVTKHAQEETSYIYNQVHGTEIIAFRFMSVYGLHEEHKGRFANLVSQFLWGMEQGKAPTIYGNGTQTRDFTNVRDIVRVFQLAIETEKKFGFTVFNIGTAEAINMLDLMNLLNKVMGTNIQGILVDNPIKTGFVQSQQADLTKIKQELGFEPTVSLEDGIREIVEYRKDHPTPPASLSY